MKSKRLKFFLYLLIIILIIFIWQNVQTKNTPTSNPDIQDEPKETETIEDGIEILDSLDQDSFLILDEIDWDDRNVFKTGLTKSAQSVLGNLPFASVYRISISIPNNITEGISGHLEVRYFNNEGHDLNEIYFRSFPNYNGGKMDIQSPTVDGTPVDIIFESMDTAIRFSLKDALKPNQSAIIEMDFNLEIPTKMGGNYGLYGFFDDILVLDTFYPTIPAFDQNGWYKQIPQSNGDLSYQDASFYLVEVNAPEEMILISSGVEIQRSVHDGEQAILFAAGPARDYYLAGSEKFIKYSSQIGEITVNSFTFSEYAEHQRYSVENGLAALNFIGQRFGEYPYTEFDILSSPMLALGVEYPGVTSIVMQEFVAGERMYGLSTRSMLESTVAHEVVHQWFYNVVGNDQQNQPWVDEALTQYATYLYFLDAYGRDSGDSYLASFESRWSRVDNAHIPIGMPAGSYEGAEYSGIVYGRGPLFFYELEKELGIDVLSEAIKNYYQSNLWGIATTEDIRYYLEAECKCDLEEFFDEWIYEN